jgi:hypothetical protein
MRSLLPLPSLLALVSCVSLGALGGCGGTIAEPSTDAAATVDGGDAAIDAADPNACGGKAGRACADGFWCAYAVGTCLSPDAVGTCRQRVALPCVAPQPGDEVCGCDGTTYQSTCVATSSGMSVARVGSCDSPLKTCGGIVGATCGATEYCDWGALPSDCGGADGQGICRPRPTSCIPSDGIYCGCDGKFYESTCAAALAGQGVRKNGPC